MSWPNRLLVYAFPLPLWTVEYLMRLLAGEAQRAGEFFAPSLAAACIGLCLPVCIPKTFSTEKYQQMTGVRLPPRFVIRTRLDSTLVPFAWMAVGVTFVIWACALFTSIGGRSEPLRGLFEAYGQHISVTIYALAVLMTELKERA
jgi:hypothetical protein